MNYNIDDDEDMDSPTPAAGRKPERSTPVSPDAVRAAPYSYRAPSPPFIHVPIAQRPAGGGLDLMPSLEHADPTQLTAADLAIITGNATQVARDRATTWTYEQRREAQPILDFLYLGPTSVLRDHAFLTAEGITMVLVTRDARMAGGRILSLERATAAVGIRPVVVDIDGPQGMVRAFPEVVRLINDHLLALYHAQAPERSQQGQQLAKPAAGLRRGKVLVVCESGNDRSAGIVAAYIMAMFGKSMVPTIQFICVQRFCCSFDEDVKRTLQTWEDILKARHAVAQHSQAGAHGQSGGAAQSGPATGAGVRAKRGVDDMMDLDQDAASGKQPRPATDLDRFTDRDAFAPFKDTGPS
ncbi:Serine/threonine/tyrosine-interacting protein [Tolypocladium paradoxum]|uniref:Serine/threonine/tyrosine-interacting protein n=1 Tax=Tolypocladium paradoxum TaxID=94208 RepID=A0A2S4L2E0_9HYPO|nr:Serine/threonine/tyrosine-interacting protein [Tolypocladium paradoxum]